MPYPNEHGARLRNPEDFKKQPDWAKKGQQFARKSDGTIYGKIKVPDTIDVIWGQLKNQSGEQAAPQALRFPVKYWSAQKAEKWLKDHNIKYLRFEPARKTRTSDAPEGMREVPASALQFHEEGAVLTFTENDTEKKDRRFKIRLYSGRPLKHWLFGQIIIDLAGVTHKPKIPVLLEHDRRSIVGYADEIYISPEDGIVLSGKLSTRTAAAQEVRNLIDENFPWEASAGYQPPTEVEFLPEDKRAVVNGYEIKGPCEIWRAVQLREGSICAFGVDQETGIAASDDDKTVRIPSPKVQEDETMMKDVAYDMTAEVFEERHPEDVKRWKEEAARETREKALQEERARFAALEEAFPGHPDFVIEKFKAGATVEEAKIAFADLLTEENRKLKERLAETEKSVKFSASDDARDKQEEDSAELPPEEQDKREFAQNPDLQKEFGSEAAYLAYKCAERQGRVKLISKQ